MFISSCQCTEFLNTSIPLLLQMRHRLINKLIKNIKSHMMVIHKIPDPMFSSRTHERGDSCVLILIQRPEHVKVTLNASCIGALGNHANSSAGEPREYDLRGAFAMICGDGKDLIGLTVSIWERCYACQHDGLEGVLPADRPVARCPCG